MTGRQRYTVAVDPAQGNSGKIGIAIFSEGTLLAATALRYRAIECDGERWIARSHAAYRWLLAEQEQHRDPDCFNCITYIFERPQIYRASRSKGDPNDLPGLAGIGVGVGCLLAGRLERVLSPTPKQWIGGLPKDTEGDPWDSARGIKVASRLSPEERLLVPASHDAIDAVGLGLFALGRFERRRVYPRG